jgi:hypothetical protein
LVEEEIEQFYEPARLGIVNRFGEILGLRLKVA